VLSGPGIGALVRAGADHRGQLRLDQRLIDRRGRRPDPSSTSTALQCLQHLEQGRLVQGNRVLCPSARTIGVVSLTITRWPLTRDHPRGRGLDLHHQRGRHRRHRPHRQRHAEGTASGKEGPDQPIRTLGTQAFQAGHAGSIPVTRSTHNRSSISLIGPLRGPLEDPPEGPVQALGDGCFRSIGHELVTPAARNGQVAALVRHPRGLPRDHNWSRGGLEAVPNDPGRQPGVNSRSAGSRC
jgi:hypothetical protein